MTRLRAPIAGAAACALGLALACATGTGGTSGTSTAAPACASLTPPELLAVPNIPLPSVYVAARISAEVIEEVVVGREGQVVSVQLVATSIPPLAPFTETALKRAKFNSGRIEGNPVAVRGWLRMPVGGFIKPGRHDPPYDSLAAFVPGGASREAQWQLAGSVERLTLSAHVGTEVPQGASIVAVGPGGAEQTLFAIAAAPAPLEIRETVKTGKFFAAAGDYRLELRAAGQRLAATTVTIAAGFETAIVNACAPLPWIEKTGPGKTPARTR